VFSTMSLPRSETNGAWPGSNGIAAVIGRRKPERI
jgi:hypothetical protein